MELAGGRPPVLAKQYFKKQAKARSIIPGDVPALLPEASMKNLQLRMDAQVARQRPLPGAKSSVQQDIVEQERGEMVARRAANSRVSFAAYDAQRANIEANLDAQRQMEASKRIIQLTGQGMALQESLGTAHATMQPNQLQEARDRMIRIAALLRSNSAIAQEAGARTLMRRHNPGFRMPKRVRLNPRFAVDSGYQPSRV